MKEEIKKINDRLTKILSKDSGYFGRVYTWGQGATRYEQVGYVLNQDLTQTLSLMTERDRKNLNMIMSYFELHALPLKKMLSNDPDNIEVCYCEIAWSHFATVVMFGMLEFAVKKERGIWLSSKGKKIRSFLEKNLSEEIKIDVARRYKTKNDPATLHTFGDAVDHLWEEIRGGFIHDMGVESKGLEWGTLVGIGSKEDPITIRSDVPMQEWLQLTWQAILRSYGYEGSLELSK